MIYFHFICNLSHIDEIQPHNKRIFEHKQAQFQQLAILLLYCSHYAYLPFRRRPKQTRKLKELKRRDQNIVA